jgi:hypothetical protein
VEKAQQILRAHAAQGQPIAQSVFEFRNAAPKELQHRVVAGAILCLALDEPAAEPGLDVARREVRDRERYL